MPDCRNHNVTAAKTPPNDPSKKPVMNNLPSQFVLRRSSRGVHWSELCYSAAHRPTSRDIDLLPPQRENDRWLERYSERKRKRRGDWEWGKERSRVFWSKQNTDIWYSLDMHSYHKLKHEIKIDYFISHCLRILSTYKMALFSWCNTISQYYNIPFFTIPSSAQAHPCIISCWISRNMPHKLFSMRNNHTQCTWIKHSRTQSQCGHLHDSHSVLPSVNKTFNLPADSTQSSALTRDLEAIQQSWAGWPYTHHVYFTKTVVDLFMIGWYWGSPRLHLHEQKHV